MNMTAKDKPIKKQIENRLVADLQPHPLISDVHFDPESSLSKQLQADLIDNGQTNIIEVTPDGDVISGLQWFHAAQDLGWDQVRIWVRTDLDDEEVAIRALEAKYNNLPLAGFAKARTLVDLRDRQQRREYREEYNEECPWPPLLQRRSALRTVLREMYPDLNVRSLNRRACVLNTPVEVQDAVDRKQLKLEVGGRVARKNSRIQNEIARRIRAGEDPKAVVDELAPPKERRRSWGHKLGRVFDAWEAGVDELEADFKRTKSCLSSDDLPQLAKVHKFVGRLMRYIKDHPDACCSQEEKFQQCVEEALDVMANPESAVPVKPAGDS